MGHWHKMLKDVDAFAYFADVVQIMIFGNWSVDEFPEPAVCDKKVSAVGYKRSISCAVDVAVPYPTTIVVYYDVGYELFEQVESLLLKWGRH